MALLLILIKKTFIITLMRKYFLILFLILAVSTFIWVRAAVAQEAEELTEYAYGTIVNLNSEKLTLLEYDYNKDEDVELIYLIDPEVNLKNITALDELKAGENVEIDFLIKNGQKIALVISLDKPGVLEDESFPENSEPEQNPSSEINDQ